MDSEASRRLGRRALIFGLLATMLLPSAVRSKEVPVQAGYDALVALFEQWRAFEPPPRRDGAPDYGVAAMTAQHEGLRALQARLRAIDPSGWPIAQQVDYHLVRAEMNGLDFNHRVLRPWARDPAFYLSIWSEQSDTPSHEGPTHHAPIDLWTYSFPLTAVDEAKLAAELRTIPPLLRQARQNLVGNARELWLAGIGTMRDQVAALEDLQKRTAGAGGALTGSTTAALRATQDFVAWLEEQAPSKTGPSGIGKENYTWALRKDLDLLGFEQQLYLRQPGYGSSYITGKYQIERLLTERSHQLGDAFKLSDFFAEVDAAGVIPVSLIRWQLTGKDDEIRALLPGGG